MTHLLTKNTGISIGLAALLLTVLATAIFRHLALMNEVGQLRTHMKAVELQVSDRRTLTSASEDALREAIANPGHRVPDPRHPGELIVVETETSRSRDRD